MFWQIRILGRGKEPPQFNSYFDRLYFSIFKDLQSPEAIEWFPTYLCNSKCHYCGGYDKEAIAGFGKIIPYEEIVKIIKQSGESGTGTWNIGGRGGEPLLYPNLIGVLETIKQYGMTGILITNGLLLDEQFVIRMINAKWDILRISLDSNLADIHDEIRGVRGNFDRIDKALSLFKKIKKEKNTEFPYLISCPVISNKNYKYIPEYVDYCAEKGVNEIQFMPLLNVHERAKSLLLSDTQKDELRALLEKIIDEDRIRHNIGFIISLCKSNGERKEEKLSSDFGPGGKLFCIHLWKTLVISEDGYLSPCSLIKDKLFKINGSHLKAWNSKIISGLRKKIMNGEFLDNACGQCCGPLRQETDNFNQYLLKRP